MPEKSNTNCPRCNKYVKRAGDNANISMEGTDRERRVHAEGWCPKKKK